MAYTTRDEVTSLFRDLEVQAADTVIIESEIDTWIAEADAVINAKLEPFYDVPITGTNSLLVVGKISKLMVAAMIEKVLDESNVVPEGTIERKTMNYGYKAKEMLKNICPQYNKTAKRYDEPVLKLYDAVAKEFSPNSGSLFNSQNKTSGNTPEIERGGLNW